MRKIFLSVLMFVGVNFTFGQIVNDLYKLLPSDGAASSYFGDAISISGNFAAIGEPWNDNINGIDAGAVYIFEYDGVNWVEQSKIIASNGAYADKFGKALCIDDNRLVVGAYDYDGGNYYGRVYFYEFDGNNWNEDTTFYAPDSTSNDYFGQSLSIKGNDVIIGANNHDYLGTQSGAAYIYKFNGTSWILQQQIFASDGSTQDYFGRGVAIDSNKVLVSADFDDNTNGTNAGTVYYFEFNGTTWNEVSKILPLDGAAQDYFGKGIDLSGNHLIVNAYYDDDNGSESGSAYIFEFNGTNWVQQFKLLPAVGEAGEQFGYDVAIDGNMAIVSCHRNDNQNGVDAGITYVFEKNGSVWDQTAKLLPQDGGDSLYFGSAVSIDDNKILVACLWDNDNGIKSGSAYIFSAPKIRGKIFNDFDEDCVEDALELRLPNRLLTINPGNIVAQTNADGIWSLDSLPIGNYTITYDTSGNWQPTCPPVQFLSITNQNDFVPIQNFGLISNSPCPAPNVSVIMFGMTPCFSDLIRVKISNTAYASGNISGAFVDLKLDSLITPTAASISYTVLGNNLYRFNLPSPLFPNQSFTFNVNCDVSCDAIPGQTLCIQANLVPLDSCYLDTIPADISPDFTPCSLPWDHSSLSINGWCDLDSIYFEIKNNGLNGSGDMQCYSPIRLFIDTTYIFTDSILLSGGQTETLAFFGDGKTWRMEVDQHPLHPGNSQPSATVERCGDTTNWTPGYALIFPKNDADPNIDIFCEMVTSSYDPNMKTGYPLGISDSHFISRNQKLDYLIQFQNTGTDTAFTVIIRDTLETDFNIFSVQSGVSSHPYTFRMYGPRVLEWKFSNILLPDSTIDEPGSHGFVIFSVDQNHNLSNGTELNNTADIYFDFNAPIITNTTSHIIKVYGNQLTTFVNELDENLNPIFIYPNPTHSFFTIESSEINNSTYEIMDITGKIIQSGTLQKTNTIIDLTNEANGFYLLRTNGQTIKLIKQ